MTRRDHVFTGRMLIGGDLCESTGGAWFDSINPTDESLLGRVPRGTAADVERAVDAARTAGPAWQALGVESRAERLRSLGRALAARAEELLHLEVQDTGNTFTKMSRDVAHAVHALEYFAGLGYELKGHSVPASPGNLHFSVREPYGVVGGIAPFNHPIMFAATRMAAPLMAGNTVVIKPAEQSPLSTAVLGELCAELLPPGVANIITGYGDEVGEALVRHPAVKRIAFTGSVETGLRIQRSAAEVAVKHITLELGGKNPMIVCPDVELEKAVAAAVAGMNFAWQGQSCGSTSRLLVHDSLYDRFAERLAVRVAQIRVGDPLDPAVQMGPINSRAQHEKVLRYIALGREEDARLLAGGRRPAGKHFERGFWVEPTVFADVTPDMRLAQEEIFGPVLSMLRWRDIDEAVAIANGTQYGLTAAVWTRDLDQAFHIGQQLHAGYVWINGCSAHFPGMPFGGFKNSGVGREGGLEELLSFTEEKAYHVILNGGARP